MRVVLCAGFGVLLSLGPTRAQEACRPISPNTYRYLTCPQIVQDARAVSRKGFILSGLKPGTGGTDKTETQSAVIIVWPASTNAPADKMSKLRYAESQINALEQASIDSQCSIEFERPKIQAP